MLPPMIFVSRTCMVVPALCKNLSDIFFQGEWTLEVNLRRKLLQLLSNDFVRHSKTHPDFLRKGYNSSGDAHKSGAYKNNWNSSILEARPKLESSDVSHMEVEANALHLGRMN